MEHTEKVVLEENKMLHGDESAKDPDLELVCLCQKGDKQAFDSLILKYQNRILNIILRMVGDYDTALDLTQETFLRAYKNLSAFQKRSLFFTWLFRIAVNIATTKRRQLIRKQKITIPLHPSNSEESFFDPPADSPTPDHDIMQRETQSKVQEAIHSLQDEFKEVLVLRDIDGLSYEDIQVVLKCPIGTVRSRLHRARAMLKDKLAGLI